MNQRSRKLVKLFLCCVMGIIIFTGCTSTDTPTDPVVVEPVEPVEEKTQLELLAEEYDHLQWYLDDATTKIVDGVTYDLTSLKQQYGDLYRFVEPLSKEEVEGRFQYLAEFFDIQVIDGDFEMYNGGIASTSQEVFNDLSHFRKSYYKEMGTTNDEILKKYSDHYKYVSKADLYSVMSGGTFSNLMSEIDIIDYIDQFSFEEKDWYVREYMVEVDMVLNLLENNNEDPIFNFKFGQRAR